MFYSMLGNVIVVAFIAPVVLAVLNLVGAL